jgi:imidazolonepropionase
MDVDIIVCNASQMVTCSSPKGPKKGAAMADAGIISSGAAAIRGGNIVEVGTTEEITRKFTSARTIDAEGKVVCPAFVDPHSHIVFDGERLDEFELKIKGSDYLDILAAGGGIISTVRNTRTASAETLFRGAMLRLDKMLKAGTGTAEIKTGYGLETETELKMLKVIGRLDLEHTVDVIPTFLPAHAVPPEFRGRENDYVDLVCNEMIPTAANWWSGSHYPAKYRHDNRDDFAPFSIDVFCEKNAFGLSESRRVLEEGRKWKMNVRAHVDEFSNLGGARMAIELGASSVDHLDTISDEEISLLAATNTIATITPTVNFNFGSASFAPARRLVDAGCAIALSTDYNPGSAPCPSQQFTMAVACRYQKLSPAEAINATTINAAHALGLGRLTGSIEPGKQADILILAAKDFREVAYEFGGNLVSQIIKNGRIVLES